jgi:hypothetical protein
LTHKSGLKKRPTSTVKQIGEEFEEFKEFKVRETTKRQAERSRAGDMESPRTLSSGS